MDHLAPPHLALPGLPPDGVPGRAHLHRLYDNREGVVLAVPGQQVLADPTEGEVPVVKALEVGLPCDETLPCRGTEVGEEREEEGESRVAKMEACMRGPHQNATDRLQVLREDSKSDPAPQTI